MREPYLLKPWEIRELTPRQIFDLYFAPRDETTGEVLPPEDLEEEDVKPKRPVGAQGVGGLGLAKHDCWKPQPGEQVDTLLEDREIARQRIETFVYEQASRGCWEGGVTIKLTSTGQTIKRPGIRKNDRAAMRDLVDFIWAEDCKKYEQLKGETNGTQGR